mmetsp:Transcript_48159/g.145480  ORF Transcript_48159/g.145480 Transcript_48159/m.145480 type:complete len:91 (+) Transcript_48159:1140-1412(+)
MLPTPDSAAWAVGDTVVRFQPLPWKSTPFKLLLSLSSQQCPILNKQLSALFERSAMNAMARTTAVTVVSAKIRVVFRISLGEHEQEQCRE